jgi:diadenylate cyclase
MSLPHILFTWRDLADVAVATVLIWGAITWLRRTNALAGFVGLSILAAVYLGATQLQLRLTAWIFQGFAAVLLVLIVVVFQDDLRRLLEQIGAWGLRRRVKAPDGDEDVLVRTVARLASERVGGIFVLPGHEPLDRHFNGGITADAEISEPLLLSLFDTSSPGHDGAIVITANRVAQFAVHLPLSADRDQLAEVGTRHAAALGLAERCDAIVIVVSEERGTVSVAHDGVLRVLSSPQELTAILREFRDELAPDAPLNRGSGRSFARQWRVLSLSAMVAFALWFLLGPATTTIEVEQSARVVVDNLPEGYALETVTPPEVSVTLSGPRSRFMFTSPKQIELHLDAFLVTLGRRTFQLGLDQVQAPPGTEVLAIDPATVRLSVRGTDSGEETPQ